MSTSDKLVTDIVFRHATLEVVQIMGRVQNVLWDDLRVKTLRIQRQIFRSRDKELTKGEYARLLETAQSLGKERLTDVLGHSSMEITRIYLASTGNEYVRRMERSGLVSRQD